MSNEQSHQIEDHLESLERATRLIPVIWAIVAGIFGLGVFVAGMQFQVAENTRRTTNLESQVKTYQDQNSDLKTDVAVIKSTLATQNTTLNDIKRILERSK
jgi:hypothetical protein